MAELDTHPITTGYLATGSSTCNGTHAKLVTRVPVSGHFCDVYGHPLFMKKNSKSF